jgi:hypothetical protein
MIPRRFILEVNRADLGEEQPVHKSLSKPPRARGHGHGHGVFILATPERERSMRSMRSMRGGFIFRTESGGRAMPRCGRWPPSPCFVEQATVGNTV